MSRWARCRLNVADSHSLDFSAGTVGAYTGNLAEVVEITRGTTKCAPPVPATCPSY